MQEYRKGTIREFSEQLGISYTATAGLIKCLAEMKFAEKIGTEKLDVKKKGKRSYIWQIPKVISLDFFDAEVEAETYSLPK